MKNLSISLVATAMALLAPLGLASQTRFSYTYEGQTVNYEVIDETARTVQTVFMPVLEGDVVLPEHPVHEGVEYTLTVIGETTFYGKADLKSIVIPPTVKGIGDRAFYSCTSLESLRIPSSVVSVGTAFALACTTLSSIEVDADNPAYKAIDGVLYTSDGAELVVYPAAMPGESFSISSSVSLVDDYSFAYSVNLKSVDIPSSVTSLGKEAFTYCRNLESLDIPESVTCLYPRLTYGSTSLVKIEVEKGNPNYKSVDGVLYSADLAELIQYPAAKPDNQFAIPSGVQSVKEYAFAGSVNLASVDVPKSVNEIDDVAFALCRQLKDVNFLPRENDLAFGYLVFSQNNQLVSVAIPEPVTVISDGILLGCQGLKNLSLPSTAEAMGFRALAECPSLEIVECYAVVPPVVASDENFPYNAEQENFEETPVESATLHVPEGCRQAYSAAFGWRLFGTIVDDLEAPASIDAISAPAAPRHIYNMQGILLKRDATQADVDALAPGLYIVGGTKLLRR